MSPDRKLQELLLRVASGDLARDSDELRRAIEQAPEQREEIEQWLATTEALDGLAAEERELAAESIVPQREDIARAQAFVRARTPRRGSRAPRMLLALTAAAALALVVLFPREREQEPVFLGTSVLELLEPDERASDWSVFRWQGPQLAPLQEYRLVVSSDGAELLRVEGLRESRYELTAAQLEILVPCESIQWSVALTSADGSDSLQAWATSRSSRR